MEMVCPKSIIPSHLLKVNSGNTKVCEIYSKLTINIKERRHWRRSVVFVNFKLISQIVVVSMVYFEQVSAGWIQTAARQYVNLNLTYLTNKSE